MSYPDAHLVDDIVRQWLVTKDLVDGCSVLHQRPKGRGTLLRIGEPGGRTVIVKLWPTRSAREVLKCTLGISNGFREWRIHRYLARLGLHVPTPLRYSRLKLVPDGRFEVMVVQDLGPTVAGLSYLKTCLQNEDEERIERLEHEVIEVAATLLRSRIIDIDHHLGNFVVNDNEDILRIDFECARRWLPGRVPLGALGTMIGRLVCSHVYACQPHVERSEAFAARVADRLRLSGPVLSTANALIVRNLGKQLEHQGIESRLALSW